MSQSIRRYRLFRMVVGSTLLLTASSIWAATNTWITPGPGTNDWFVGTNWSGGVPAAGDDVVITNASVVILLTNFAPASEWLSSLTISNTATLVFSNWTTSLTASNVTILTNGLVTLPAAFTNNQMSNRVWFVCSNLTIAAGASINADGKGYRGGTNAAYYGQGPGGGGAGAGGAHGGPGGDYSTSEGGQPYDSYGAPIYPGSGGGGAGDSRAGGNGGGAVQIVASGQVTVNGAITANGNKFTFGAGSGGAILIACNTFAGTNGVLRADGGDVQGAGGGQGILGPGGGGRIAVTYNWSAQQPLLKPTVLFSVGGRNGRTGTNSSSLIRDDGDMGTIYFTDTSLLNESWLPHTGQLWFASGNAWAPNQLIVSNGWIRFPAPGFQLIVSNDLRVIGPRGNLEMGGDQYTTNLDVGACAFVYSGSTGPTLRVGGSLVLTNGGCLTVYAGLTNASTNYGALVAVTNMIWIDTNSWLYPHSNPTNGGSVLLTMANLIIPATTNGGIGADGRGYRRGLPAKYSGWGPGSADYYSGGGYGGEGGRWSPWLSGPTYGSSNAPTEPGSSGGGDSTLNSIGGNGGGLIRIQASDTVLNRGVISANGENSQGNGGGGSGGGIYVVCKTFGGDSNSVLRSDGGTGQVGGGGGRIAVWRVYDTTGGQLSSHVNGSIGIHATSTAFPGTIVWGQLPVPGTIFSFH